VILDNLETLLEGGSHAGQFRSGYKEYGELLRIDRRVEQGASLKTLRIERPYEGMNVAGVNGLTAGSIATLKSLGAIEQ
jgi:hypothetical protein